MPEVNLDLEVESIDKVPEAFRPLYDVVDGKAVLTGVNNMKTPKDVTALQEALRKEREDHAAAKNGLKSWDGLKPDEVRAKLARIEELELAAAGKIDEKQMEQILEGRVKQKVAPIESQLQGVARERDEFRTLAENLQRAMDDRDRNDLVRAVALEMKVHTTALDDIMLVAQTMLEKTDAGYIVKADARGATPGLDIKGFMREMQKMRPHWWPASEGGGALGGGPGGQGGKNPWSAEHWNLTEQSKIYIENPSNAEQLAKSAGTFVGGTRPMPKK